VTTGQAQARRCPRCRVVSLADDPVCGCGFNFDNPDRTTSPYPYSRYFVRFLAPQIAAASGGFFAIYGLTPPTQWAMIAVGFAMVISALAYLSLKRTWLRVQPATAEIRGWEITGLTVAIIIFVAERQVILWDPLVNLPLLLWMPVSYGILWYRTRGRPIGGSRKPDQENEG
jgi:hypothetical protein